MNVATRTLDQVFSRANVERLYNLVLGMVICALLLVMSPYAVRGLSYFTDILVAAPVPSTCTMMFDPDACIDTSLFDDLRGAP